MENMAYWNGANDKYVMNSEYISGTAIANIKGYWLLSSRSGQSTHSHNVYFIGLIYNNDFGTAYGSFGARPVITVSKSDLSS